MDFYDNIIIIAELFKKIKVKYCFVGAFIIPLYSEKRLFNFRPTQDIDVIIEVSTYGNHNKVLEKLRKEGVQNYNRKNNITEYIYKNIFLNIIPLNTKTILGFENKWYKKGFEKRILKKIKKIKIPIFAIEYFIASKIEAYNHRGKEDIYYSHDLEDIITILSSLKNFDYFFTIDKDVKQFLRKEFKKIFMESNIEIEGFFEPSLDKIETKKEILSFINNFIKYN